MSRIFRTFTEARHEIQRDLAERSIMVHPETMQDKVVGDDRDYETREIQNFHYTVTQPNLKDLSPVQPWADREFNERLTAPWVNPGEAYKLRPEVWEEFLEQPNRMFSYTYSERLSTQIDDVIDEIKRHPNSRQLWVSIWDPTVDPLRRGRRRVPCSLGYHFLWRQDRLDITYVMRSCDFFTHWENDVYLARRMQEYVAKQTGMTPGFFTQIVFSLHVYAKDVADVF